MSSHSFNHKNNKCFVKDRLKDINCGGNDHEMNNLLYTTFSNEFEYILLRSGLYDLPEINLKEYTICDAHYNHLTTKIRRNHCNTCKTLFNNKFYSTSDLCSISRLFAYGIWQEYKMSFFDQNMCGGCRKRLEKKYCNSTLCDKSQSLFAWIYNEDIVFTPSSASFSSHSIYEPNEEEQMPSEKRKKLKQFSLNNGYIGRIQMTKSYNNMQEKSQNNFRRQVISIVSFILQILAPNDFQQVWNDILEWSIQEIKQEYKLDSQFGVVMNCIANAYNNATHWSIRRQILSIVALDVPGFVLEQFIPDISVWKLKAAKEQAYFNGQGSVVNTDRATTIRYKDEQIAHFIQYILSPHITTDLPFGKKKITLSSSETLIVPNTMRNLIPSCIINGYKQDCKEVNEDFQPLNDTCLFEILNGCAASTRKSLQGLDYFAGDGVNAFDTLQNLCDELATFGN